jgi:predicted HD superfamily hydrolase involved in NAD metabolism
MDRTAAERLLHERLSARRIAHSQRVAGECVALAARFGASTAHAELAGLLHDLCRELEPADILRRARGLGIPVGPVEERRPVGLLHGPVAAAELAAAGLPGDVTAAIARHTVGGPHMSVLEKCLYLADFCEPGRAFAGLEEVRALSQRSLDEAVAAAARLSLLDLIGRGRGVVPAALALYNESHAAN